MQAMHTPPDTSSALAFPGPGADDSWTIFDQGIMSLANPPWLFEDSTPLHQTQKPQNQAQQMQAGLASVSYDSGLLANGASSFASAQWNNAEQMQGALPSTLSRIFGHENSIQDSG